MAYRNGQRLPLDEDRPEPGSGPTLRLSVNPRARRLSVRIDARAGEAVVIGSDTEVVLDGRVFGKPVDAQDAAAMDRTARLIERALSSRAAQDRIAAEAPSIARVPGLAGNSAANSANLACSGVITVPRP